MSSILSSTSITELCSLRRVANSSNKSSLVKLSLLSRYLSFSLFLSFDFSRFLSLSFSLLSLSGLSRYFSLDLSVDSSLVLFRSPPSREQEFLFLFSVGCWFSLSIVFVEVPRAREVFVTRLELSLSGVLLWVRLLPLPERYYTFSRLPLN